jgi:hypothetical protein
MVVVSMGVFLSRRRFGRRLCFKIGALAAQGKGIANPAHSRALAAAKPKRVRFGGAGSGNPALGPRFGGDERVFF